MTNGRSKPGRKDPIKLSDHALFRWLERAGVLDVPQLRAGLSAALDRAYQAGASLEVDNFLIMSGGLVFIVRNGVLVTVTADNGPGSRANCLVRPNRAAE